MLGKFAGINIKLNQNTKFKGLTLLFLNNRMFSSYLKFIPSNSLLL